MMAQLKPEAEPIKIYAIETRAYYVEQGNLNTIECSDALPYDKGIQDELVAFGNSIGIGQPLRVFFLWENSD
jgi:hypothetical protein